MGNENNRKSIEKDLNFTHMDLYKIMSITDNTRHKRLKIATPWYTLITIYTILKMKFKEFVE